MRIITRGLPDKQARVSLKDTRITTLELCSNKHFESPPPPHTIASRSRAPHRRRCRERERERERARARSICILVTDAHRSFERAAAIAIAAAITAAYPLQQRRVATAATSRANLSRTTIAAALRRRRRSFVSKWPSRSRLEARARACVQMAVASELKEDGSL